MCFNILLNLYQCNDAHQEVSSVSLAFLFCTGLQTVQVTGNIAENSQILFNDLFSQVTLRLSGRKMQLWLQMLFIVRILKFLF